MELEIVEETRCGAMKQVETFFAWRPENCVLPSQLLAEHQPARLHDLVAVKRSLADGRHSRSARRRAIGRAGGACAAQARARSVVDRVRFKR